MELFLSVGGALIIVIGAILLTYWGAKYLQDKNSASFGRMFKVIDRIMIGKEKYIVLLQFQEKYYLLGVSDNNITLLEKMDALLFGNEISSGTITFKERLASLKHESFFKEGDQNEEAEHGES